MRSQLKALFYSRLSSLRYSFLSSFKKAEKGRSGKARSGKGPVIAASILMVYLIIMAFVIFYSLFSSLAAPYHELGIDWLYFAMYTVVSFGFMFFGTVFLAKSQLFEAKDNELLLSMPIKPRHILFSRISLLIAMNLASELIIAIPAFLAWIANCGFNAVQLVFFLVINLLLPLFAAAVTSLFGWLLSLVTRRIRQKAMVTTVLSLVFFGLYFVAVSKLNTLLALLANGTAIAEKLSIVAPVYWIGSSIGNKNLFHLIGAVLVLTLPFLLCCLILSATFIKTVTSSRGFAKIKYRERAVARRSIFTALYRRELARLLSSSMYLLNAGMGAVMAFAMGILLCIFKDSIVSAVFQIGFPEDVCIGILAVFACMTGSMTMINACSVSMEGKNLWIVRSCPVPAALAIKAKLALHLSFSVPSILMLSAGIIVVMEPTFITALFVVLLPLSFGLACAVFGLFMNLRFPILNWTSETQAVKNGLSVTLSMFVPWGAAVLMAAIGALLSRLMPITAIMGVFAVIWMVAAVLIYRLLMRRGTRLFDRL